MSFHSKLINTLGRVQDSKLSVSDAGNVDDEGSVSSAILGKYGEDDYPGSFENAIDLFEAQGLKLTRKDNSLIYQGKVPCAGGTARVTVVLYGKRSDANSSLREAHVTSMSLFARVLTSSELPKGWIIAQEEHTYRPSELPRAMQVLAMRVAQLLKSSFETDDALETAITRSFLGGRKPNITEEDRKQAKEFAESIFGRGADSVEAPASRFKGRREVKDASDQGVTVRELYKALRAYNMTELRGAAIPDDAIMKMSCPLKDDLYFSAVVFADGMLSPVTAIEYSVSYENDYLGYTLCSVRDEHVESVEDVDFFVSSVLSQTKSTSVAPRLIQQAKKFRFVITKPYEYAPVLSRGDVKLGSPYFVVGSSGMMQVTPLYFQDDELVEVDVPAEKLYLEMYDDDGAAGDTSNGVISIYELFQKVGR